MPDHGTQEKQMGLRCRDGDLALIVNDEPGCESNIGRTVQVSGSINVNADLRLPCWLIQPIHQIPWKVFDISGKLVTQFVDFSHMVEHPEEWLLPLREITENDAEWGVVESMDEWLLSEFGFEELDRRKVPIPGKQGIENVTLRRPKPQPDASHDDSDLLTGGA
jgi:hypothetical protein